MPGRNAVEVGEYLAHVEDGAVQDDTERFLERSCSGAPEARADDGQRHAAIVSA
jgi:hypothetical protein